jgi:hypothetical protein
VDFLQLISGHFNRRFGNEVYLSQVNSMNADTGEKNLSMASDLFEYSGDET